MPGAGEGLGVWSAIGPLEHPLPPDCLSWVHVPQISLVSRPAENLGGFPQGVLAISHPLSRLLQCAPENTLPTPMVLQR